MCAEHELTESWKHIPRLQQEVALQGDTLSEQAVWLHSQIDALVDHNRNGWAEPERLDALAKLSLLSEIYSVVDFDKMIEVREKFQEIFPDHFAAYLNHLDSLMWQMSWAGCLECRYFNQKCSLGLIPTEPPGGVRKSERYCRSKELRFDQAA